MVNIQCQCWMLLVWFGMCWLLCGTLGGKLKFQLESTPDPAAPGIPAHGHRPLVNTRYWAGLSLFWVIWQTVWYLQLSWTGRWHRWHPPHSWHSLSFQQMSSSYKGQTNGEPADSVRKSHTSPTLYISGLYSVKAPELLSGVQWQTQPSNALVQTWHSTVSSRTWQSGNLVAIWV